MLVILRELRIVEGIVTLLNGAHRKGKEEEKDPLCVYTMTLKELQE